VRRIIRVKPTRAQLLLRNVGVGTADKVRVKISWGGTSVTLPQHTGFMMGPGDERRAGFDVPEALETIDSIEIELEDVLGNKISHLAKDRPIQ